MEAQDAAAICVCVMSGVATEMECKITGHWGGCDWFMVDVVFLLLCLPFVVAIICFGTVTLSILWSKISR